MKDTGTPLQKQHKNKNLAHRYTTSPSSSKCLKKSYEGVALIQQQVSLNEIVKEPLIISKRRERSLKDILLK